jgi:hypothetical protein
MKRIKSVILWIVLELSGYGRFYPTKDEIKNQRWPRY